MLNGGAHAALQQVGGDDAEGEIARAAGVEQQAHLGLFPLEDLLELVVGQQIFLNELV